MSNASWELGFHLRSPRGWLNDPNGACQFRGEYYLYYQYNDSWPKADQKAWGLFVSPDLVHWRYEGMPIEPSIPEDRHGVYSGCTLVEHGAGPNGADVLRAFYTGNVVCLDQAHNPRDVGRVYTGREAHEITCASADGKHFGEKTVLLRTQDYPWECSLHVRDPKVWRQDGRLYMLLGARHLCNHGMCLLYVSNDGWNWEFAHLIEAAYPFGYMWECPNIVQLADGSEYLAFSPQGLPRQRDRWHNVCQAGYIPLPGRIVDTREVDERDFVEWDHGHDFYAPQTFVDDSGRWILVGWLGSFDHRWTCTPDGLAWCHCLTVPRLLRKDPATGLLLQTPVPELDVLRGEEVPLAVNEEARIASRHADIVVQGIDGDGALTFDQSLQVFFEHGRLGIRYLQATHAAGRDERSVPLDCLRDVRVLVDGSAVEVYANDGAQVFSSRWFSGEGTSLAVHTSFAAREAHAWPMEDVLSEMYATAQAPSITLPGWNA
ncbi:MAG: glycoside hydrolase family 32 protein [Coriobacteriales bacterium]|nr:glycoside hydrolase family 32 protein [Coriobacteriales bacterium]